MKRYTIQPVETEDHFGDHVRYDEVRRIGHEINRLAEDVLMRTDLETEALHDKLILIAKSMLGEH